jgi:hypothetical protein
MTISILRTNDAWWVQTPTGAAKIATTAATTGELLADRTAIDAAAHSADTLPVDSLDLVSPVTAPCRVVAQMTNFASHVRARASRIDLRGAQARRHVMARSHRRHGDAKCRSLAAAEHPHIQ